MEELKLWCENLILAVIAVLLIELLIPDELGNKKYIKVVSGIFIMFIVLNPVIDLLNGNVDFDLKNYFAVEEVSSSDYEIKIKNVYINALEKQIKESLNEIADIRNLYIDFDDNYENVEKMEIIISNDGTDEDLIKEHINKEFLIEKEKIIISYK